VSWKIISSLSFKGIGNKKFVNFQQPQWPVNNWFFKVPVLIATSVWILVSGVRRDGIRKNKLIDIGLRWHSLDIEQSYWTVISGHWMVL